uniref:Uncharacterized protein n=1 Tax=Arundo donax TaxID=35708 RepID=A0A0A9DZZ9_ARUDO
MRVTCCQTSVYTIPFIVDLMLDTEWLDLKSHYSRKFRIIIFVILY